MVLSTHLPTYSLTGAQPSRSGSRLSRVVSASFSPAMLCSTNWGTPEALTAPTGIYNPSNESWAYPRAIAQLAPGAPSSCSVPHTIPPGGLGCNPRPCCCSNLWSCSTNRCSVLLFIVFFLLQPTLLLLFTFDLTKIIFKMFLLFAFRI